MKKVLFALLLLVVLGALGFFLWSGWTYSEGSRSGYLFKISKKGYVFKTYEGQLNLGGIGAGDGGIGSENKYWNFSVSNGEVFEEMERYEGKRVNLKYRQVMRSLPWQGETDYFVEDVELIE